MMQKEKEENHCQIFEDTYFQCYKFIVPRAVYVAKSLKLVRIIK